MGLSRLSEVAGRLGVLRPATRVVTIAGTNGKGSTTVALETLLLASGLRVGATLSPHVSRFNERVRLQGEEVSDDALCHAFTAVDEARADILLTYFEYSALAALYLFTQAELDVAILEIGLGGRLDAFNAVDADLAIVTSIGLDHQDYLGTDLEAIGIEKAGIFRHGQDVVLGTVTESVHASAARLDCRTFTLGREIQVQRAGAFWRCDCQPLALALTDLSSGALAPANVALALTAATLITGQPVLDCSALRDLYLPGRMERFQYRGIEVIVDVAHNGAAAEFLAAELIERFPHRRYVAIYGALEDKDAAAVVQGLDRIVSHWLLIPTTGWRGQDADALAARIAAGSAPVPGQTALEMCEDIRVAFDRAAILALSLTGPEGGILAFGSFSAVEQARKLLNDPAAGAVDG